MNEVEVFANLDQFLPKPHDYKYEERLVAYIDIMGWKMATSSNHIPLQVKQALAMFDEPFNYTSEYFRERVAEELGQNKNPFYKDIECGIYSDGILVSMPIHNGPRIFSIGNICRKLITFGFLSRGGITKGLCYHRGNRAVGPAINAAVELEGSAHNPTIICCEELYSISETGYLDSKFIMLDPEKKMVLNLFPPFIKPDSRTLPYIEKALQITEIKKIIQENISLFKGKPEAEKQLSYWQYAELQMNAQLQEGIYDQLTDEVSK